MPLSDFLKFDVGQHDSKCKNLSITSLSHFPLNFPPFSIPSFFYHSSDYVTRCPLCPLT